MSRRRQRGPAYRLRRKFRYHANGRRPSPFVSHVDPKMVELLTAPSIAASLYANMHNIPKWDTTVTISNPKWYAK